MGEDEVLERWSANRKAALVLGLLKGKRTLADACGEYDLKQCEVEEWMELLVHGGTNRLKSRPQDEQTLFEERERQFKARIGELVLEGELVKKALAGLRSDERTRCGCEAGSERTGLPRWPSWPECRESPASQCIIIRTAGRPLSGMNSWPPARTPER